MAGKQLRVLQETIGEESLHDFDGLRVDQPALLDQQFPVGDLVRQGMLEVKFSLLQRAGFIKKLSALEKLEASIRCRP